jgi:Na+/H+ antiporter NhaD/arsenite permease-like protein
LTAARVSLKILAMVPPSPVLILPFGLLLGAMALAPVAAPRWWAKHYAQVALGLGALTAAIYFFILHDRASLAHAAHEYTSFIALVGSLFVVAGGIQIQLPGRATPLANVAFLFAGAVAANFLGTTGAAMLLIRPWLQMNRNRIAAYHVVFFIFLVANVGGCLTPIGDPPLFLGYLQGVPFWWVAKNCWPMWLLGVGLLLGIFYGLDKSGFNRAARAVREKAAASGRAVAKSGGASVPASRKSNAGRPQGPACEDARPTELDGTKNLHEHWQISGRPNLFFLALILGAIFLEHPPFLREGLMLAAAAGSYFTTKKTVHAANGFDFHPIQEVAILFAGIFATMIPALAWLDQHAVTLLGQNPSPAVFFWGTGGLSSALDNAPTYLGFLSALRGVSGTESMAELLLSHAPHVLAISVGAVFFGAATYIGNGPNFMVKAIAEQRGIRVPSFLEFIWKFSLPVLLPVLIIVWLLCFRAN